MRETIQQPDPPSQICPICGAPLRGQPAFCPACGGALRARTGQLQTTQVLAGRYRIERLVARGGMGAVYLAEDTRLGGAPVAVKEMASSFVQGDTDAFAQAVADFRREAAMLARLRHSHLPRVSDQFDEGGKHYLVMEFIAGRTLAEELRQAGGRLPVAQALGYADQLCDVLSYLHGQSPPIIYRDLKPSNVMVLAAEPRAEESQSSVARGLLQETTNDGPPATDSQLVLIDFGIARFYRPGQAGDTAIYGTTGYAPPEQYGRGQTDARTDIYALGVLLHQLLTGHDPTSTPFALPPPRTLNPAIPPQVADAITRATTADREARFADIAAFRAALRVPALPKQQVVRRGDAPAISAMSAPLAAPKRGGSGMIRALVGILVVLLAAGVLALGLFPPLGRVVGPVPTAAPVVVVAPTAEASPEPPDITPAIDSGGDIPPTTAANGPAAPLRPIEVRASGTAGPGVDSQGQPVTYDPQNAIDGQPGTTWRVAGDGVEQWIELDFGAEVGVQSIGLIPGYDKIDPFDGTDRFFQSRVVQLVRFEFSDSTRVRASFAKSRDMQFVRLPSPIRTRTLRIVIEATYPPPAQEQGGRDFTPISEVLVQGSP